MRFQRKAFSYAGKAILSSIVVVAGLSAIIATNGNGPPPVTNGDQACIRQISSSLFVAGFDNDTVGAPPAPSTPLHYGPPGASLDLQGDANAVLVVDSTELASKALSITRGQFDITVVNPTVVDAVLGDNGNAPYASGVYFVEFMAHGEQIPDHLIAGVTVSILSPSDQAALVMKLYDGAYHLLRSDPPDRLSGSYDPGISHAVLIRLDLTNRNFTICIDGQAIASGEALFDAGFSDFHSAQFFATEVVTESFPATYVVDEVRIAQ